MPIINIKDLFTDANGDSADFISVIGDEKDLMDNQQDIPETIPILPIRNTVLFPGVIIPVTVSREKSLILVKNAYKNNIPIGVIAQKDLNAEEPGIDDLYRIGTAASVIKILEMPDGSTAAILQGKRRFFLEDILYDAPYNTGKIVLKVEERPDENSPDYKAISESLRDMTAKPPNSGKWISYPLRDSRTRWPVRYPAIYNRLRP